MLKLLKRGGELLRRLVAGGDSANGTASERSTGAFGAGRQQRVAPYTAENPPPTVTAALVRMDSLSRELKRNPARKAAKTFVGNRHMFAHSLIDGAPPKVRSARLAVLQKNFLALWVTEELGRRGVIASFGSSGTLPRMPEISSFLRNLRDGGRLPWVPVQDDDDPLTEQEEETLDLAIAGAFRVAATAGGAHVDQVWQLVKILANNSHEAREALVA